MYLKKNLIIPMKAILKPIFKVWQKLLGPM